MINEDDSEELKEAKRRVLEKQQSGAYDRHNVTERKLKQIKAEKQALRQAVVAFPFVTLSLAGLVYSIMVFSGGDVGSAAVYALGSVVIGVLGLLMGYSLD